MPHQSETKLRVRYAETDQMGVVYYANYFVWMEIGRTDFCRHAGFNYRDMEQAGVNMAVADASCRYLAPARYDDEVVIMTVMEKLNRRLVTFRYVISNGATGVLLAEGRTVHITVGSDGRTRSVPEPYFAILAALK